MNALNSIPENFYPWNEWKEDNRKEAPRFYHSKNFYPWDEWKEDGRKEAPRFYHSNVPTFVIDQTTKEAYLNESRIVVSIKCLGLALATPFVHTALSLIHIAYRIFKLVTLWWPENKKTGSKEGFKAQLEWAKPDYKQIAIEHLKQIAIQPLVLLGIELSAIYGIFNPYDGRKMYASFEREFYAKLIGASSIIAPCFQPDPTHHLFGGDLSKRNVF